MAYVIASLRNSKPYSFYHSDKRFYCGIFSMRGCNLRTYKSFTTAKRTFDKLHFKGVDLVILEVNNGESVEDGKEVFRKPKNKSIFLQFHLDFGMWNCIIYV